MEFSRMLVLSRFRDESIRIDLSSLIPMISESPESLANILRQRMEVMVIDIRGDKVRLGIEAPESVPVHREEVYQRIQEAKGEPR